MSQLTDDDKAMGRMTGEQDEPAIRENLFVRLLYMILIGFMISLAQTILFAVAVIQFVVMLFDKGTPNPRLAEFGTDLGIWMAKAVRYNTAASEVKPWPWTELD